MKKPDVRGIVGATLLMLGAIALVGGFGTPAVNAADPDRYIIESDHHDDFDSYEFEMRLEEMLGGLEGLEALEGLGGEMEMLGDEISVIVQELLEDGAMHIDGDWPDVIRVRDRDDRAYGIDTREIARSVERIARQIERDVIRDVERDHRHGARRAWRVHSADRDEIEAEMRDLQREMRRLERELERIEEEGDI